MTGCCCLVSIMARGHNLASRSYPPLRSAAMNATDQAERDRICLTIIGQSALLIVSGLLLLAASVLFAALMLSEHNRTAQIIALLNAGMFYLWGMGGYTYVMKTWKSHHRRAAEAASAHTAAGG